MAPVFYEERVTVDQNVKIKRSYKSENFKLENKKVDLMPSTFVCDVLQVKLRCGLKNEVADVDEPSRCE
jgi:hypothetical protein